MSEHELLAPDRDLSQHTPVTRRSLAEDLDKLGLRSGMTVLVHTSVTRLGWVLGGPQTVIEALDDVLGATGTLMMPTHSMQLTDPRYWRNPPVPESWWPIIRQHAPLFDKHLTPTRLMGAVAELFRNLPGVLRSDHPHGSFAARGPQADQLVTGHALEDMFGEASPLGHLYKADGHVLLLGVDHGNNTSLHLAENRAHLKDKQWLEQGARLHRHGATQWVAFRDFATSARDFAELGEQFANDATEQSRGAAGWGDARLMRQRAIVDYGVRWLEQNRN